MEGNFLTYRGFSGSAELSIKNRCLVGSVILGKDLYKYSGDTLLELETAFKDLIDDFLSKGSWQDFKELVIRYLSVGNGIQVIDDKSGDKVKVCCFDFERDCFVVSFFNSNGGISASISVNVNNYQNFSIKFNYPEFNGKELGSDQYKYLLENFGIDIDLPGDIMLSDFRSLNNLCKWLEKEGINYYK